MEMKEIKLKHLWLETTNRCNANCIFCAREHALPPCDMDLDLFKSIIDQCPEAKVVQTQGFGEPLLYPHIVEAVEYAAKKHDVVFYTNGALLTEELSQALLDTGMWRLIFSVDDMTKEKYEYFRPPLKWDILLENVNRFQRMRTKGGYKTLTTVRMCETKENRPYINQAKDFWRKRVDVVTSAPEVDIPPPTELRETPYVIGRPILDCPFPYNYLSVKSNGDMVLCCRDWFHIYTSGNLHDNTVKELYYEGKEYDRLRQSHKTGNRMPYLCHICKTKRAPQRYNL